MEKKTFEELADRLREVNKLISKLDPAIRASAFEIFKPYVGGGNNPVPNDQQHARQGSHAQGAEANLEALITAHPENRPNENVELLTAHWYSKYGTTPFSLENLRTTATEAGLTIPQRLDMTLKSAKDKGKTLYQSVKRGLFKPTVPGEMYLKTTYAVRKGSGTPPAIATGKK